MADNTYESIKLLYEQAKFEYNYQRERLQKFESKVELTITLIGLVLTFEITNVKKFLNFSFVADLIENIKILFRVTINNVPYFISFLLLNISIVLLLIALFNAKCRIVSLVKLYNDKIYNYSQNDYYKYLTALYVKIASYNHSRLNRLYKLITWVVVLLMVSIVCLGIAYIY